MVSVRRRSRTPLTRDEAVVADEIWRIAMSLETFLATPRTFLNGNIVLPPARAKQELKSHPQRNQVSGVFEFAFIPSEQSGTILSNGLCPVFRVEAADAYNTKHPRFRAYFCFFEDGELHMLVVDSSASLMFTPTMNGCSFGVGSATESGARIVGHANVLRTSSTPQGIQQQETEQAKALNAAFSNPSIIGSSQYITGEGVCGTTLGIRTGKNWSFCTQSWKRSGPNYTLHAVTDFA
jgi:hypothetical protein